MVALRFERVLALPPSPVANTVYFVRPAGAAFALQYVTGNDAVPIPVGQGGTIIVPPTLGTVTLSGSLQIGTATSGTLLGTTALSSVASNIPGITFNSGARTYAGTPTGSAGTIANGIVETLAGAIGSPRSSAVVVAAAALVAPAISTAPTFTGTAQDGQTLTGTRGTYTNSPTSYTNQWQRSTDGTTWTNISGATALTYAVVTADVGKVLRLTEIAINAAGSSASNVSAASGAVAAVAQTDPTSAPQLTRLSTAGENPLAVSVLFPDDIDHTGNKVRAQRTNAFTGSAATPNWGNVSLVEEVIQLDENMVEGQDLPLSLLTSPMPEGYNAVRMREENAAGDVVTPYSAAAYDTLAPGVNYGFGAAAAGYTLSNGNKTATRDSGSGGLARGSVGYASGGKRYFEVAFTGVGSSLALIGLTSNATLGGNHTTATDRLSFAHPGVYFLDGVYGSGGSPTIIDGRTIGVVYDPDNNSVILFFGDAPDAGSLSGPYTWDKAMEMFPFALVDEAGGTATLRTQAPFYFPTFVANQGASAWNA